MFEQWNCVCWCSCRLKHHRLEICARLKYMNGGTRQIHVQNVWAFQRLQNGTYILHWLLRHRNWRNSKKFERKPHSICVKNRNKIWYIYGPPPSPVSNLLALFGQRNSVINRFYIDGQKFGFKKSQIFKNYVSQHRPQLSPQFIIM